MSERIKSPSTGNDPSESSRPDVLPGTKPSNDSPYLGPLGNSLGVVAAALNEKQAREALKEQSQASAPHSDEIAFSD